MAVKERSQIKGTSAQIEAFAGHNGVLAFATDTKSLHVLSGTAGATTEFLPSTKTATKTELSAYAKTITVNAELAKKADSASLSKVATSGVYGDLSGRPTVDTALSATSTNAVQNKVIKSALDSVSTKADTTGYQVGDIKLYAGSDVPDGWFRCDGSTIADMATNYPKLYAVLGTNVLPNYSGRYPVGADASINQTVEAGLPNITATTRSTYIRANPPVEITGAITATISSSEIVAAEAIAYALVNFGFDASKANAIYGSSNTVTPPSVKCAFLIKHD